MRAMINLRKLLIIIVFLPVSVHAQSVINWNNLYDKSWRKEEVLFIQSDRTITLYKRGQSSIKNYDSVIATYKIDGTKEGFNFEGKPFQGNWEMIDNNHILSKGDSKPAKVIVLTNNEFVVQINQIYKSPYTNEEKQIILQTKYSFFDPCSIFESLRSGNWNDQTIWTCQKIPRAIDKVLININHRITIPENFVAHAQTLAQKGKLEMRQNARLVLGSK